MIGRDQHRLHVFGAFRPETGLGGLAVRDADDVDGLEGFGFGGGGGVTGEGDDRAAVAEGVGEAGDEVCGAGA